MYNIYILGIFTDSNRPIYAKVYNYLLTKVYENQYNI